MPRGESSVKEGRLRFVARLLDGEPMTDLCREFGISRKTGYKVFNRYRERGCCTRPDKASCKMFVRISRDLDRHSSVRSMSLFR